MPHYLDYPFADTPGLVSTFDEVPLWSAFGDTNALRCRRKALLMRGHWPQSRTFAPFSFFIEYVRKNKRSASGNFC